MILDYSWGRIAPSLPHEKYFLKISDYNFSEIKSKYLVSGNLRSYGDVAYNDNGIVLSSLELNHFIDFDREHGTLTVESGVLLATVLSLIVPCGWFLPVTPGTKYLTMGGAVANDVHGKNHHKVGSFGCFIDSFELLRSDGERLICSRLQNNDFFRATIGGMGLTGVILWVKINLLAINNHAIVTKSYKFSNLNEYLTLNETLERDHTYTVAWVDCLSKGKNLGRGIYYTGEHAGYLEILPSAKYKKRNFPFTPSVSLINNFSLRMFNNLYYHRSLKSSPQIKHYDPFFYPLDKLQNWNRIYGKRGFYQYQCVIPDINAAQVMKEILHQISKKNSGSFLAVLKTFGSIHSGGLMSFPRKGMTLALDFANLGSQTLALFQCLDNIVCESGGAIYAAKDATQSPKLFKTGYPLINEFIKYVDPQFSSNLWQRLYKD